MDELDLSPEESERLKQLREALQSEFATQTQPPKQTALKDLEDLKPDFLEALKHVTRFSPSESLRAKVAMWGFDKLLETGKTSSDPLVRFFEEMKQEAEAKKATT